jgi:hypothetical protein
MSKNSLSSKVLAIEMELNLAEQDLDSLSADSAYLEKLANTLTHNIDFLKKEAKIVSAIEYKRACVELAHVGTKIRSLSNQICQVEKSIERKMLALDYYYKLFDMEYELESNKVLLFRGKNVGQE